MKKNKKAAIELSVGTIVIVVLAMTMLILWIFLIRNIFSGATYNVDELNSKVRDEIGKLFTEQKRTVIYLSNQLAEIEQGEDWGIAFGIKNLETGTQQGGKFSYEVRVNDPDITRKCGIPEREAENWIVTGRMSSNVPIAPGQVYYGLVRFQIPETAPLCTLRFQLLVKKDGATYDTNFFDVKVVS